jgi:glucose/arabinose dehydrogenase
LPAISLGVGQRLDLWVSNSGATYYGTSGQTEPDFSFLARQANLDIPFIATQPGYIVELVGMDYRLPVNIAFVENPGPNPDDPLYFVTELYGSIQVVTRDGTKHTFATGLLDYNPTGPISGSGEQGLTGIAVQRDEVNPEIYNLYVGMLWDNGSPPGGAAHYPKVEKLISAVGGLTMASRELLLNMQPETQGQSHQISNITIGPDGLLYVHVGDGFNAGTAQNLDQYRGKVLRMNLDGSPVPENPFYNGGTRDPRDYIFAYGFRNPFGGAWRDSDGTHYQVENGPSVDRLSRVLEGVNYGWNGSDASMEINAIYNWDPAHAPVNMTFVQQSNFGGSMFPESKQDHLFVSESGPTYANGPQGNGKRIVEFELDANGALVGGPTTLVEYVGTGRSSIVGLASGPDGLYFTELYEETGASGPTAIGARIFRVRYVNLLPGDYNIDGVVDEDDHDTWSESFGSNVLLAADGNRDKVVSAADYVLWRDRLGATLGGGDGHDHEHGHSEASADSVNSVSLSVPAPVEQTVSQPSAAAIDGAFGERFDTPRFQSSYSTGNRSRLAFHAPHSRASALLLLTPTAIGDESPTAQPQRHNYATAKSERSDEANLAALLNEIRCDLLQW